MVVSHNRNRRVRLALKRELRLKDQELKGMKSKRVPKQEYINPRVILPKRISQEEVFYLTLVIDYANRKVEFLAYKTNLNSIPWPDIALVTKTPFKRRIPLSEIKRTRRKFLTLSVPKKGWLTSNEIEKVELLKRLYPRLMTPDFDSKPIQTNDTKTTKRQTKKAKKSPPLAPTKGLFF